VYLAKFDEIVGLFAPHFLEDVLQSGRVKDSARSFLVLTCVLAELERSELGECAHGSWAAEAFCAALINSYM
jgi:hypothetical protein